MPLQKTPGLDNYYFIDTNEEIPSVQPTLRDDVIRLYNIQSLAQSLTRVNLDGSKGVKLRKSYKSHISDLPGKHNIPTDNKNFVQLALMPENPDLTKPKIEPFNIDYLNKVLNLEKTGPNGIPGFDSSKLALSNMDYSDSKKEKKRKINPNSLSPEQQQDAKRRHVQVKFD
ncbi:RNA polymerase II holoenzyme/mediator subunit [Pichia californica]|uniref:Mediator of RNA polymerase II transcription subunit 19 n=1 Tax=Pichia californica TaxID=460514 RepID=A0A9P7BFX7_9ASCO|nr:RNA polymerase II holoenzyme/mediator subunit [[Candida] californica]KAG0689386.1 RNA polymerase II holoenzyme/mediator subunit [[Candida] californica]